jgi:large subunit ribosomal protein L17
MRHLKRKNRLTLKQGHRRSLILNLAKAVFTNKQIVTTYAKAKTVQPVVEKILSYAMRGGLHAYRLVEEALHDQRMVKIVVEKIAPHYKEKKGGYTRVIKLENRLGDNAPMALVELIGDYVLKEVKVKKTPAKQEGPEDKEGTKGTEKKEETKGTEAKKPTAKKIVKKVVVGEGEKK